MRREFLGRGWRFPFGFVPANGSVALSEFERNIQESVTVILGTRPGERQMLPEFGCRIHELVFAPNTHSTATIVEHHVREALERWEPRIDVDSIESWPDDAGTIRVVVHYRIKSTQELQELHVKLTG